jgi:SAM-dependent methyltransferase
LNFSSRSYQKELLDRDDIPFEDIKKNMQELEVINTLLGGHAITIKGFKKVAAGRKRVSICEIGCGGGDNLKAIYKYAAKNGIEVAMTGIDLKQECITYARENCRNIRDIKWICADYRKAGLISKPDIIFSSLFCHHFDEEGLAEIFDWMTVHATTGFFINDLQRHPLAYHSIKLLTSLLSNSYLVKNDAPLSVQRGFHKTELLNQVKRISDTKRGWSFDIQWQWAFRWLLTGKKITQDD